MQWTGLNELREKYLHYFEGKGHLRRCWPARYRG